MPGEANLWPSLTGAETLHLLGRVQGQVDTAYRDELVERFDLDPSKKVRQYSKGNRQKLVLIAALMSRADLLVLDEPTSGLDPLMEQTFRQCAQEATAGPDRLPVLSHPERGGGAVRPGRHPARRRAGRNGGLSGHAPPLRSQRPGHIPRARPRHLHRPRGERGGSDRDVVRCQVLGPIEPLLKVLAEAGVKELLSQEPSLEELFLAHYGTKAAQKRPGAVTGLGRDRSWGVTGAGQ